MRVLGAILAGGHSRRFGSDKANALLGGRSLFDHVIAALGAQTEGLAVCGRAAPGMTSLADRPDTGVGPLAGLNTALHHAHGAGFDAVLCVPLDVHPLPSNLRILLQGPSAKVLAIQHVIGFWPVSHRHALDDHLANGRFALRDWISASGAARLPDERLAMTNVNRIADLNALEERCGNEIAEGAKLAVGSSAAFPMPATTSRAMLRTRRVTDGSPMPR